MICRLCVVKCEIENAIALFREENCNLSVLINRHLNIELHEEDHYLSFICKKCWQTVKDFDDFFQMVQEKQDILENYRNENSNKTALKNEFQNKTANTKDITKNLKEINVRKEEPVEIITATETEILLNVKYEIIEEEPEIQQLKTEFFCDNINETEKIQVRNEAAHALSKEEENIEKMLEQQRITQKRKRSKRNPEEYRKGDEIIAKNIELKCYRCNRHFELFHELKAHYRQTHEDSEGYVICCNRNIYNRTELLDHINSHTDPEIFKCKICEKQFVSRKFMNIHSISVHSKGEGFSYSCKICNKGFPWLSALKKHMDCHKTERSHVCSECGTGFQGYTRLRAHIRNVHIQSNYTCEICGQCYKHKLSLSRHIMRKHKNEPNEHFGNTVESKTS